MTVSSGSADPALCGGGGLVAGLNTTVTSWMVLSARPPATEVPLDLAAAGFPRPVLVPKQLWIE